MAHKPVHDTQDRIIQSAWQLFYQNGYDNTTIEDIIRASQTSRGSFYRYFEGKDALLYSLSYLFDREYERLQETLDPQMHRFEQLMYLNQALFSMIETQISFDLLARLYSSQLITRGEKHLLDSKRLYYRLLKQVIAEGQARGELSTQSTTDELVHIYALCERSLIYDWCLAEGQYSLRAFSETMMPTFMNSYKADPKTNA